MALKIEDINREIDKCGWHLISTTYKNLQTEMEFQCPKGHRVSLTLDKWRRYHECPLCLKAQTLKRLDTTYMPPKQKGKTRILAFDQATKVTGWSVFDGMELIQYGTFESKHATSAENIETMRQHLAGAADMWRPDRVCLEDIQLQGFGSSQGGDIGVTTYKVLAQLQGVMINYLYTYKIPYDIAPTGTWRNRNGVKGKTRADMKRSAQLIVKQLYDIEATQDEADAILIGRYAAMINLSKPELIEW